jgi:hypothetical protein
VVGVCITIHVTISEQGGGRRRERAVVRVVRFVAGQEGIHVDVLNRRLFDGAQVIPERSEGVAGRAFFDEDADDSQAAILRRVHEVDFRRVGVAIHRVLTGRVEVELQQVVRGAVHRERAAGVVDLDAVAGIDEVAIRFVVRNRERA